MKQKFMKFSLLFAIVGISLTTLSSFIATDEGDSTRNKKGVGGGCTYDCVWIDNLGNPQHDLRAGTLTSCQPVQETSTCTPVDCAPLVACPKH